MSVGHEFPAEQIDGIEDVVRAALAAMDLLRAQDLTGFDIYYPGRDDEARPQQFSHLYRSVIVNEAALLEFQLPDDVVDAGTLDESQMGVAGQLVFEKVARRSR